MRQEGIERRLRAQKRGGGVPHGDQDVLAGVGEATHELLDEHGHYLAHVGELVAQEEHLQQLHAPLAPQRLYSPGVSRSRHVVHKRVIE